MSNDLKSASRELLEDFIKAYESQPCLWNLQCVQYHNRAKRNEAYEILLQKLKQLDTNASKDDVVKKINALRTSYRKEQKRVEEARLSGTGETYRPTLWYYPMFHFLEDQKCPKRQPFHLRNLEGGDEEEMEFFDNKEESTLFAKPQKRSRDKCDSFLESIEQHLRKPRPKEDRYDVFGRNLAMKMRDVTDHTQKLLAERIINDALFMAEMGLLTMTHSIRDSPESESLTISPPTNVVTDPVKDFVKLSP